VPARHLPQAKPGLIPAEEAFIITVGVSHKHREADCSRALRKLQMAGFSAGPTSDEAILQLAEQVRLTQQLEDND
jgi:hypothetical protein